MSYEGEDPTAFAKEREMKQNMEKQQRVVECLWEFARRAQKNIGHANCTQVSTGTKLLLSDVDYAMKEILDTFGYKVIPVD